MPITLIATLDHGTYVVVVFDMCIYNYVYRICTLCMLDVFILLFKLVFI